jgi:glucose-6-phosphate 1-dehydrogenase
MMRHFVIFGASGDLTSRYLLPTLAQLRQAERISTTAPERCAITIKSSD